MVTITVPGKVHLIGEHAVVYGQPAIIAAVGKRVSLSGTAADRVRIEDSQMGSQLDWTVDACLDAGRRAEELWEAGREQGSFTELFAFTKGDAFKKAAIGTMLDRLGCTGGVDLTISSTIPLGSGLGSSSALSVALAAAVAAVNGKELSREEANQLAYTVERYKHGMPSGGDNTACCYGGMVWFQKDEPNIIEPMAKEVPYKLENFVLVYIKEPERTTGELVAHVRDLEPGFRDAKVLALGAATRAMRVALRERDMASINALMNTAWDHLASLGLSVPEADELITAIRGIGGAAKLCGACGGGIMLAHHTDKERLARLIRDQGYEPWETELGVEGLQRA